MLCFVPVTEREFHSVFARNKGPLTQGKGGRLILEERTEQKDIRLDFQFLHIEKTIFPLALNLLVRPRLTSYPTFS